MKYFSFVFFLFLAACSTGSKVSQTDIACDKWTIAAAPEGYKPVVIRIRECSRETLGYEGFPKLIRVLWEFEHNGSGMPGENTSGQMRVFEDRLVLALEQSGGGVHVAVVTMDGFREWVFYVKDKEAFREAITYMPQEQEPYPVRIDATNDAEWQYLRNEVSSLIE